MAYPDGVTGPKPGRPELEFAALVADHGQVAADALKRQHRQEIVKLTAATAGIGLHHPAADGQGGGNLVLDVQPGEGQQLVVDELQFEGDFLTKRGPLLTERPAVAHARQAFASATPTARPP